MPQPSLFGIDTGTFDSRKADFAKDFIAARKLGARWDRFTLSPETATGNWRTVDSEVNHARQQGMGVVLSFRGIAAACSLKPTPSNVSACPPRTSTDLGRYRAYVRKVVLHYRGQVSYYESWVQPNDSSSWLPTAKPAEYAALLKAQYAVFKSVNHSDHLHLKLLFGPTINFLIGPGSPSGIAVLPFTHQVLADLHGQPEFDGVSLHAYRFPPGPEGPSATASDYVGGIPVPKGATGPYPKQGCNSTPRCPITWPQELSALEQEFTNHGYHQPPMWVTEFGWPGNRKAGDSFHPSEAVQALYLKQAYADLLKLTFVQGALWFNLRDYQPGLKTPDPEYFYHYGLLRYDYSRKPAAKAFAALVKANPGR